MVSKKSKQKKTKNFFFFFTFFREGKRDMVLGGKWWLFSIGNGAEIQPLEMGRKSPAYTSSQVGYQCDIGLRGASLGPSA